jgi:hypothetical protein
MMAHIRFEIENTNRGLWAWRAVAISSDNEVWITAQGEERDIQAAIAAALKHGP